MNVSYLKLYRYESRSNCKIGKKKSMDFAVLSMRITETRNREALKSIEQGTKLFPKVEVVNKFEDESYNRVGYTLVSDLAPKHSSDSRSLKSAVFEMVKAAYESVDLASHRGSHPRLGVVDHICFHPLASTSLEQVAATAKSLATEIGSTFQVPTYLYGAAHYEKRSLDSIRRALGYFRPNFGGNQWAGGLKAESLALEPDAGSSECLHSKGVLVVGATEWVDNYNIPVFSTDIAAVRRIAKRLSTRGGGLPFVQSMALSHGKGIIEVACNLLEPKRVGGRQVQIQVEQLASEEGMTVGKGYYTDFSQEKIVENYLQLGCS